jgi:hypothetical protein
MTSPIRVAALYVEHGGCYYGLPDVEPWGLPERDAREYAGPWPVVAHPPCARWCRLAELVESRGGKRVGDDGGCFAAALAAVRRFGGVLEHPAWSKAWRAHDLPDPLGRGWCRDIAGGWCCEVSQACYGHRAPKLTWLYAIGVDLARLDWSRPPGEVMCTTSRRVNGKANEMTDKRERLRTPLPFRDLLLSIARTARRRAA